MATKYQQNQWNKVKEHFREHPYYKLCKTVFGEFQNLCPTMVMNCEQLFVDASLTLDSILQEGDRLAERCQSLWTDKYNQYREQDGISGDKDDSMAEVAMLFYMVMYGVTTINNSHYRGTLQRTLHDCIFKLYYGGDIKKCLDVERNLREPVNQHTDEMIAWMTEYFVSTHSLTKEIGLIFHPNKKDGTKESRKKKEVKCYTLKYNCPDEKMRVKRIDAVMRMMVGWEWIEEPQVADDFQSFFSGSERNCNLIWHQSATVAILTDLIKRLLLQHYIDKVTGVSARSIVKNQFNRTPDNNKGRVDAENAERIQWVIDLLDYNKPLPLPHKSDEEGYDNTYKAAMQAVFTKDLHITKDLNRKFD